MDGEKCTLFHSLAISTYVDTLISISTSFLLVGFLSEPISMSSCDEEAIVN